MSKPELSVVDCELMERSEDAEEKALDYFQEHGKEFESLSPDERQKKLAEVMFGV